MAEATLAPGRDALGEAHHPHEHPTNTGISNTKLAMWVFLGSDCLLFGALISTFLLYQDNVEAGGVGPLDVYDIPFTSLSSFVLLMSSLTMVMAHDALARDDQEQTRTWLFATGALGTVFLGGQVFEFTEFIQVYGMTLTTNPASSSFYLLTGFHGVHVAVGVLMLFSLFGMSLRHGRLSEKTGLNVELVGLYWHFVDIIWIVIFTIVYLLSAA